MDLNLTLGQKQVVSPQMRLALSILQMNSMDLDSYVEEISLENPLIEFELHDDYTVSRANLGKTDLPLFEKSYGVSLKETLMLQIPRFSLTTNEERILVYLIDILDDNGYLPSQVSERVFKTEIADYKNAVNALQAMEPAGVGARSLVECLMLQLRRQNKYSPILGKIISEHLDLLAERRFLNLSRILDISVEEVKCAHRAILRLNPKPGNGFNARIQTPYIRPDLVVESVENGYKIHYNETVALSLSKDYSVLNGSLDTETAEYIGRQYKQAKWLINCVEQRKQTILGCAQVIIESQSDFFSSGPGNLRPLRLSDVSDRLGIHVSTVSRALCEKYLQCEWGVFKLNDFFSNTVGGKEKNNSRDMVMGKLRNLIACEDKRNPLSDQRISEIFEENGISVSRRAIAKYRKLLNIPSSSTRKYL